MLLLCLLDSNIVIGSLGAGAGAGMPCFDACWILRHRIHIPGSVGYPAVTPPEFSGRKACWGLRKFRDF
jgi:hypothetical protein